MEEKKEIKVVTGDSSNLDISPVYENIAKPKPSSQKPKNIVIPKTKKERDEEEKENNSDEENSTK